MKLEEIEKLWDNILNEGYLAVDEIKSLKKVRAFSSILIPKLLAVANAVRNIREIHENEIYIKDVRTELAIAEFQAKKALEELEKD